MKLYKALIVDIVKHNNEPTSNLIIQVPNIHTGLSRDQLPIAKPLGVPGSKIDKEIFLEQIEHTRYIYVMFENNNYTKPLYLIPTEALVLEDQTTGPTGDVDIMVGTATVFTQQQVGTEIFLTGLQSIDGINLKEDDLVLVAGNGAVINGLYIVQTGPWILAKHIETNQVVSIDKGYEYGGAMLKKLPNGTTTIVKNPEKIYWATTN